MTLRACSWAIRCCSCNYPEDVEQAVLDGLQVVLREALEQARDFRLSLAVGLSNPKRNLNHLQAAYREAYGAIQSRFVLGTNRLIEASEINLSPATAFSAFGQHREALRHSVDVLDRQLLGATIRVLLEDMHAYLAKYQSLTFSLYTQVLRKCIALMSDQKAIGADDRGDTGATTACFENCFSLKDYDAAFEKAVNDAFDQLQQTSQSTQNQSIAVIKRHIDEHYASPLTLEHLVDISIIVVSSNLPFLTDNTDRILYVEDRKIVGHIDNEDNRLDVSAQ